MSDTLPVGLNTAVTAPVLELCNIVLRKPTDERNVQAVCRLMSNHTLVTTGNKEALRPALRAMLALLDKEPTTEAPPQ